MPSELPAWVQIPTMDGHAPATKNPNSSYASSMIFRHSFHAVLGTRLPRVWVGLLIGGREKVW